MQVIMVEDFYGYVVFSSRKYGIRYYPVYQDRKGNWKYYKNGNGYKHFASTDAVVNFFKS